MPRSAHSVRHAAKSAAVAPAAGAILRIVSGGQTGADQAALDFALARGWPHGGWCPHGRRTEDGPLPLRYRLQETPADDYRQRTEWNVRDSDGTVICSLGARLTGGSAHTVACARRLRKPWLHLTPVEPQPAHRLREFVAAHGIRTLNVAGPRVSEESGVGAFVRRVLEAAFRAEGEGPLARFRRAPSALAPPATRSTIRVRHRHPVPRAQRARPLSKASLKLTQGRKRARLARRRHAV